jgi:hypothetical protein
MVALIAYLQRLGKLGSAGDGTTPVAAIPEGH